MRAGVPLYAPSLTFLGLAATAAVTVSTLAQLHVRDAIVGYMMLAGLNSVAALCLWSSAVLFITTAGTREPFKRLIRRAKVRLPVIVLPAIIFPLFLSAYTTAKSAIPFMVGFQWDRVLTNVDRAIFFIDPWRITHALLGTGATRAFALAYWAWLALLFLIPICMAMTSRGHLVKVFFPTFMATWFIGGVCLAYLFSSAGPAFADMGDPELGGYFHGLRITLIDKLGTGILAAPQAFLRSHMHDPNVVQGGGISAMPSMHVATAMIYVLAARNTRWFWPAVTFCVVIWIGSVHLGYHYAVDGPAGAAIAWLCWHGMERLQPWIENLNFGSAHAAVRHEVGARISD